MPITQNLLTFLAQFDVAHHVWGALRAVQFGARRQRKHHRVTNQLRGVATIQFVSPNRSGFDTLDLLQRYGIPAWAGGVLGMYDEAGVYAPALEMHVPGSQARWARYLLQRHGVLLLDERAPAPPVDVMRPVPRPWSAVPRDLLQPAARRNPSRAPRSRELIDRLDLRYPRLAPHSPDAAGRARPARRCVARVSER